MKTINKLNHYLHKFGYILLGTAFIKWLYCLIFTVDPKIEEAMSSILNVAWNILAILVFVLVMNVVQLYIENENNKN